MKTIKLFGAVVILTFFLAACLDVDLKVKVKPDGSGTIEEQVLLSDDIVEMLSSFGEVDEEGNKESFNMYNEAELIAQADDMGEGVKFIGGEKITIDGKQGYKAVFEFRHQ